MNLKIKNKLREKIFLLMDEVQIHLKKDSNIDNFLDKSYKLENWEKIIPQEQYPIFVIAVLNNLRSEAVINSILNSVIINNESKIELNSKKSNETLRSSNGEHPFN
tara:strand:- start:90 stop:407 length:318 start_codon:yes stop_codon:yes gene_type:complete